jgi:hypothetical protein
VRALGQDGEAPVAELEQVLGHEPRPAPILDPDVGVPGQRRLVDHDDR